MTTLLLLSSFVLLLVSLELRVTYAHGISPDGNSITFKVDKISSVVGSHFLNFGEANSLNSTVDTDGISTFQNKGKETKLSTNYIKFVPDATKAMYKGKFFVESGLDMESQGSEEIGANIEFRINMKHESSNIWKIQIKNHATGKWLLLRSTKPLSIGEWNKKRSIKKISNVYDYFNKEGKIEMRMIWCSRVCDLKELSCDMSALEWSSVMNRPCWQFEMLQGRRFGDSPPYLVLFRIRTKCECSERDYTVNGKSCEPWEQANLSNCIKKELVQDVEINFGNLYNVMFGLVRTTIEDIDFQGETSNNKFCNLNSAEDIEFGGGECPIQFSNNYVETVTCVKDFQFETGTWVGPGNTFLDVTVQDDFQFSVDDVTVRDTEIVDNTWGDINVNDKCNYNPSEAAVIAAGLDISGNTCDWFYVDDDDDCATVFAGFDCA